MKKHFVILHGWQGNSKGHWQNFLAEQLEKKGHEVSYPQFSNPWYPKLAEWLAKLDETIKNIPDNRELVVVTHSLGGALWLQYASRHPGLKPIKVILVAPPLNNCGVQEVNDFFPLPLENINIEPKKWLVIASDNDPIVPFETTKKLAEILGVKFHVLHNAEHISISGGFGDWPWIQKKV